MKHTCSAPPRVVSAASCVCLWLWSVASAVGTRTGAMSRCILAVYTSYKQYITVWTRERPPVRVLSESERVRGPDPRPRGPPGGRPGGRCERMRPLSYTSASKRTPDRRDPDDRIPPNTRQIHGSHTRIQHAPLLEQPWRAQQWIAVCRLCHLCTVCAEVQLQCRGWYC